MGFIGSEVKAISRVTCPMDSLLLLFRARSTPRCVVLGIAIDSERRPTALDALFTAGRREPLPDNLVAVKRTGPARRWAFSRRILARSTPENYIVINGPSIFPRR